MVRGMTPQSGLPGELLPLSQPGRTPAECEDTIAGAVHSLDGSFFAFSLNFLLMLPSGSVSRKVFASHALLSSGDHREAGVSQMGVA